MKKVFKKLWKEFKRDWKRESIGGRIFLIIRGLIMTGFIIYVIATLLFLVGSALFILIIRASAVI